MMALNFDDFVRGTTVALACPREEAGRWDIVRPGAGAKTLILEHMKVLLALNARPAAQADAA